MSDPKKLKIVVVSAFYSVGMGYSENCLSKALARMGHEVHVVTSNLNVYGNEPLYEETYLEFLGPAQVDPGTLTVDGYCVHRLPSRLVNGYVYINGLLGKVRQVSPDIVHSLEIASLQTFELSLGKLFCAYKLFTETHQTMSVMRPYMKQPRGAWLKRLGYRLTRTLPTSLASRAVDKCYAVTPDCGEVAERFYGVPSSKLKYLSLGADTETFRPVETDEERSARRALRNSLGFTEEDIVCVYTGRFTRDKNPLLLAKAIDALSAVAPHFKGLFIGDGVQKGEILNCKNTTVVPFMTHSRLADHYRAVDIGVWPRQESMSMIDAASSGVPIIVSDRIGEPGRVNGNGKMYVENDVGSLVDVLKSFATERERSSYGDIGRRKMLDGFSWSTFAQEVENDFLQAVRGLPQQGSS